MVNYPGIILIVVTVCGFCISSAGHAGQPNPYVAVRRR